MGFRREPGWIVPDNGFGLLGSCPDSGRIEATVAANLTSAAIPRKRDRSEPRQSYTSNAAKVGQGGWAATNWSAPLFKSTNHVCF
jgi:hypothetical protein